MYYIKNKEGRDLCFEAIDRSKKVILYCFKSYSDTGNIISDGITEVSESEYDWLKSLKPFCKYLENGKIEINTTYKSKSQSIDSIMEDNTKLAKEVKETKKKSEKIIKEKDNKIAEQEKEIESLKAKLNAYYGKKADKILKGE